jgi:NAD dependent epimerase/dehydratase family enzyme
VTNEELSREIGRALGRPSWLKAPSFALRLVLGEMADALVLGGQRVVPEVAFGNGFVF